MSPPFASLSWMRCASVNVLPSLSGPLVGQSPAAGLWANAGAAAPMMRLADATAITAWRVPIRMRMILLLGAGRTPPRVVLGPDRGPVSSAGQTIVNAILERFPMVRGERQARSRPPAARLSRPAAPRWGEA